LVARCSKCSDFCWFVWWESSTDASLRLQ